MGLIQTPEQLRFSYVAILECLKNIRGGAVQETAPKVREQFFA